jgi:hypothetical protein
LALAIAMACLVTGACLAYSGARRTAVEEFASLQKEADAARRSGNKQARLQVVLKVKHLLNDAPDAVEAAAEAYAEAGDPQRALAALRKFSDLGQADDGLLTGENRKFAALEKLPQYQAILKRFTENKTVILRSEPAFELPDRGLLAEDIDYDPGSKTFLITSVLEKKILRVTPEGKATDFARSPSGWPMLALKADSTHNLVWATEVALDGFTIVPKSEWGRSAVLCFDLAAGKLRQRIVGPAPAELGDMVLTREGNPIVSDGGGGGVYRVNGDRLERIDGGDFISPQTPAMHPDGKHVFVPDYARGVGVLDLTNKSVTWLNRPAKYAVNGIDGLYFAGGALIATQNGTSPERVIRFELNSRLSNIVSEEMIERATATLGDPTHGVVVDNLFYYIANSGWNAVNEHGDLKPGSKQTPARIMRFRVR